MYAGSSQRAIHQISMRVSLDVCSSIFSPRDAYLLLHRHFHRRLLLPLTHRRLPITKLHNSVLPTPRPLPRLPPRAAILTHLTGSIWIGLLPQMLV